MAGLKKKINQKSVDVDPTADLTTICAGREHFQQQNTALSRRSELI